MDKTLALNMKQIFPSISIIFTNYNGGQEPLECLKSIKQLKYPKKKIEIIVIDNASKDGSGSKIARKFPSVLLVKNKRNIGFVQAINQGIELAKGKYLFIGNDDIVFAKNTLLTLVNYMDHHPETGVLGCKILYKDNPDQIASSGYMIDRWTGHVYISSNPMHMNEPDWIQGCGMLIPKKIINKIGYFDSHFTPVYFEDADFCFRTCAAGFSVVYLPTTYMLHRESVSMNKNISNKYYYWYRNKIQFIIKNFQVINIISSLSIQVLLVMPIRALILRDGRFLPFIKGALWNIKHLR